MIDLPEAFEVIEENEDIYRPELRQIYYPELVETVFNILGFKQTFHLQSFFEGQEIAYLRWFMYEKKAFNFKSPAEVALENRKQEVEKMLGRLEHGVFY